VGLIDLVKGQVVGMAVGETVLHADTDCVRERETVVQGDTVRVSGCVVGIAVRDRVLETEIV